MIELLVRTLKFFLIISGELIVLFIFISFLVGLLQEYIPAEKIEQFMKKRSPLVNYFLGAGFGSITPFCSCSTIPIMVGLLNAKIPFGPVMAFLLASPLLNPVIIILFLGLMGLKTTLVYIGLVFPLTMLIGYLWEKLGFQQEYKDVSIVRQEEGMVDNNSVGSNRIKRAFAGAVDLFKQVFLYLILGAAIGSLIYGLVPEELIIKIVGGDKFWAIPLAAVIGIPLYVRAETIIPISSVFLAKGMGIGAVMALIIGGAGASIPEITLLGAVFKRKVVIAFVVTIILMAISVGYIFSIFI